MIHKNFYELSLLEKDHFYEFLKSFKDDRSPAVKNMWDDDWANKNYTLPYLLHNTTRFIEPNGSFFIYYNNDDIVACAGVYVSEFNKSITLIGVRLLIAYKYRHQNIGVNIVFPHQKQWATEHNQKMIVISFNDYNKNLSEIFTRQRLGEKVKTVDKLTDPKKMFYNGYNKLSYPVLIQNTKQWVIYEYLDKDWFYDWSQIKYE
jgi:predicted GNAT family N-acyltransferase